MRYDIRWEHICDSDLEEIYGSLEEADAAVRATEWRLARDPALGTWPLAPRSDIRLASVMPYKSFPAVYLSFSVFDEPPDHYCLVLRARPGNVAEMS